MDFIFKYHLQLLNELTMVKTKQDIKRIERSAKLDDTAFTLDKALQEDVQNLENAKVQKLSEIKLKEMELKLLHSELSGIESAVYSLFYADAKLKNVDLVGKQMKFLGDFKYVAVNKE